MRKFSKILIRKRKLTLEMIRNLNEFINVPLISSLKNEFCNIPVFMLFIKVQDCKSLLFETISELKFYL